MRHPPDRDVDWLPSFLPSKPKPEKKNSSSSSSSGSLINAINLDVSSQTWKVQRRHPRSKKEGCHVRLHLQLTHTRSLCPMAVLRSAAGRAEKRRTYRPRAASTAPGLDVGIRHARASFGSAAFRNAACHAEKTPPPRVTRS